MTQNNSKVVGYASHHIGASKTRSYEDRHFFDHITTQGHLNITLAIVADGVGGGNLGQRAAELTIETVVNHIKDSAKPESDIPQMIGAAVGKANKAVYYEAKKDPGKSGMSSTISVALIHNNKLYVANVGDSRIYLIRDGKVKQITVDHTFASERIRQGILTAAEAYKHPNANSITRSIGFEQTVVVDLGLYINNGEEDGPKAYANQGLALEKNDVVLVCSDGLIKERYEDKNRHYVENNDILSTLEMYRAEGAAKVLVDLAVGRNVDDNVTAIVVEFGGRKIKNVRRQRAIAWSGVSLLLLLALFFVARQLAGARGALNELTQANMNGTGTSMANTAIVAAYTLTPTVTPRPTMVPGEIGAVFLNGSRHPFLVNTPISASDLSEVHVNHTGEYEDGQIYLLSQSKILFEASPSESMNFVVFPGSQLFVYPGRYAIGAGMRLAGAKGTVDFLVSGSCMALNYTSERVVASCYEGECSYQVEYGEKVPIPVNTEVILNVNTLLVDAESDISIPEASAWLEVLPYGTHARQCVSALMPIMVTPTNKDKEEPDPTSISPTNNPPTRQPPPTQPPATQPPTKQPPTKQPPTEPPPTEPPATEPPTEPPPTEPPATEPPTKEPKPTKEPPPTEPPAEPTDPPAVRLFLKNIV